MFGPGFNFGTWPTPAPDNDRPLLPATQVRFPQCQPRAGASSRAPGSDPPLQPIVDLLQSVIRPPEIRITHLEALGVNLHPDVPPETLLPDPSYLPDPKWQTLTVDEARELNEKTRRPLSNGNQSPGCQVYLDRVRELSTVNEDAFRTVRRIPPPKGQQQARLGNSYEFFRCLENFTPFWDDTTLPPKERPPLGPGPPVTEEKPSRKGPAPIVRGSNNPAVRNGDDRAVSAGRPPSLSNYWPTGIGAAMNNGTRQNLLAAFLKLVAYDFGCNVSASRTEPRLYLTSQPHPRRRRKGVAGSDQAIKNEIQTDKDTLIKGTEPQVAATENKDNKKQDAEEDDRRRRSYFNSACTFLYRSPTTREAARAGIVEGPLAAVSARATISFERAEDELIDLARELVAALVTAQHRAREGRTEPRAGEGKWWCTRPRWGGGPGGPIGREVERDEVVGDKDESPASAAAAAAAAGPVASGLVGPGQQVSVGSTSGIEIDPALLAATPAKKKARRNLSMYDAYRMVRPPSANWDPKARYAALGKQRGKGFDDVFVVSSLFHHVCVVRVRVPDRLLEVLGGADEEGPRSWGTVEVYRSRWYDYFKKEDRVEAMGIVWGMAGWLMRAEGDGDVKMTGV